ncbi:hypothetical protein HYW83_05545 [Candidatus Peregrinibacteria bacterium]|nr:hypothetical protein [Candidatus Peregrinibacteria bacterium]
MVDPVLLEKLKQFIQSSVSLTADAKQEWLKAAENFSDEQANKLIAIFENEQKKIKEAGDDYLQDQDLLANEFLIVLPSLTKI